ncbi:hypothetical protein EI94DRAFT_1720226 [Lactarius quietus]|nr:hypothetical protein EI94DRAFT_1720226 [Lactarius quietus]
MVAVREIGPRFTLKPRSLKKGLPAVNYLGGVMKPSEFDSFGESEENKEEKPASDDLGDVDARGESPKEVASPTKVPPKADEYEWVWKIHAHIVTCPGNFVVCRALIDDDSRPSDCRGSLCLHSVSVSVLRGLRILESRHCHYQRRYGTPR